MEKQALILPTLFWRKQVECYMELETETKKRVKSVKDELMKRLRLCCELLMAGKLFMVRSQQEQENL